MMYLIVKILEPRQMTTEAKKDEGWFLFIWEHEDAASLKQGEDSTDQTTVARQIPRLIGSRLPER